MIILSDNSKKVYILGSTRRDNLITYNSVSNEYALIDPKELSKLDKLGVSYESNEFDSSAYDVLNWSLALPEYFDKGYMQSLTSKGVEMLSSKEVGGRLTNGCDLADDWIKQNGGFVPFDSNQFTVVRSSSDVASVSELRYTGKENVHVVVPDGVRYADRMFSDKKIASCDLPDSVKTAYDIGGSINNPDLVTGLPKSSVPVYLGKSESHSAGWKIPENTQVFGSYEDVHYKPIDDYDPDNDFIIHGHPIEPHYYPAIYYKNADGMFKYSAMLGVTQFDNATDMAKDMLKNKDPQLERGGAYFNFTAEGMRFVSAADNLTGELKQKQYAVQRLYRTMCNGKDDIQHESASHMCSFPSAKDVDFGDMQLHVEYDCPDSRGYINFSQLRFKPNGYYADGTNFDGKPFDIPEGIKNTDGLFENDTVLRTGVALPASLESARSMYAESKIESLPEFPKDSRLYDMRNMCMNCGSLSDVPNVPENAVVRSNAFFNTPYDDDKPILNKSAAANTVSRDASEFEDLQSDNSISAGCEMP